jgi:hypothetical protein
MSSRSRVEGVRAESFLLYCALEALPSLSFDVAVELLDQDRGRF